MDPDASPSTDKKREAGARIRLALAIGIGLAISAYTIGIVAGKIQDKQKLSVSDLGLILIAAVTVGVLLRPELLDNLTHVKVGSVEFELRKLQQDQEKQRGELDDVRFVLTLLLEKSELQHLKNLATGNTQGYLGRHSVRVELRRLRKLDLIHNRGNHRIGELADNVRLDLATIVELTQRGKDYLDRLEDYTAEE